MTGTLHRARGPELPAATLYGLLRLRVEVFVVEQGCPYAELDGRDLDAATVHLWIGPGEAPLVYARLTSETGGIRRIGRVCTAATGRGQGLATRLLAAALDEVGEATCVISAQAHLTGLYGGLGFTISGPGYDWDGVPHVPMRRAGTAPSTTTPSEEDTGHD
jgi:ElaA protein